MEFTASGKLLSVLVLICLQTTLTYGYCQSYAYCSSHGCYSNGRCHCNHGYQGSTCHIVDPCYHRNPCHNGGTCHFTTRNNHHYYCSCTSQYTGFTCSERKHPLTTPTTTKATTTTTTTTTTTARPTTTTTATEPKTTQHYHECFELAALVDISNGKISINENASSCRVGDHSGSEAFVLNRCRLMSPTSWKKGQKVLELCNELPMYRAIAMFSKTDTYIPHTDSAGIFLGCFGDGFQIAMQTCDDGLSIRRLRNDGIGRENASLYFAIL